jgi:cellulose synthase/poly-beta-1,6-N-acetylglucosamine synthase-like glycosyltransferase
MGLHNAVCVPSPPSLPLLVSRVLTVFRYLLFASVFITIKSVEAEAHDGKFTFGKLFTNEIFFTLIVSLLSTYVLWIFISLVFLDPWHIVTSVAHPSTHRLCNVF